MTTPDPQASSGDPLRQAAQQGLGRALALALNLFSVGLVIAELSPSGYGAVTLTSALAYFAGVVAGFGMDTLLFRHLSTEPEAAEMLGAALLVRAITSAAAASILAGSAFALGLDTVMGSCLLASALAVLCGPLTASHQVLKSRVRLRPFAIADVAGSAITLLLILAFARDELAPWEAVLATSAANLAVWAALATVSVATLTPTIRDFRHTAPRLLRGGMPLVSGELLVIGYYRTDVILLGGLASTSAVGLYGAVYKLVDVAMYAQTIVVNAFFPSIARSWSSVTSLSRSIGPPTRLLLGAGCVGGIVGIVTIPSALDLLGGGAYGDPVWVVAWLMLSLPFLFLNRLAVQTLVAGHHGSAQVRALAAGFGGTIASVALIPLFGAAGAALATLLSEVLIAGVATALLRRRGVAFPFISSPLLASALLGLALTATAAIVASDGPLLYVLAALGLCGVLPLTLPRRSLPLHPPRNAH